jgi:hypothetical protein
MAGGGIQIMQPRRKGGHGDILSAAVLALWAARAKRKSLAETLAEPGAVERARAAFGDLSSIDPALRLRGFV